MYKCRGLRKEGGKLGPGFYTNRGFVHLGCSLGVPAQVRLRHWFHREPRSPGVEAARECDRIYTAATKLLRRTDASSFVRSGAVGNDERYLIFGWLPLVYVIGEHPYAPGDLSIVLPVAGA